MFSMKYTVISLKMQAGKELLGSNLPMIFTAACSGLELMDLSRYSFPYNQREGSQSTAYEGKQAEGFSIGKEQPVSSLKTFYFSQESGCSGKEAKQKRNSAADKQTCSEDLQKTEHCSQSLIVSDRFKLHKKGGIVSYAAYGGHVFLKPLRYCVYAHLLAGFVLTLEFHDAVDLGEQRIIAAFSHVHARVDASPALAHDDCACIDFFSIEPLDTKKLRITVSAIP
jgi:hypothetical protein